MSKSFGTTSHARTAVVVLALVAAALATGCGEEGKPHPGYTDPCDTPMAATLGCPPGGKQPARELTVEEACRKLVTCGVLAESYLERNSADNYCPTAACDTKRGGKCVFDSKGVTHCHYPKLDYFWCVYNLSLPESHADPCDQTQPYTSSNVQFTSECIGATPCPGLGVVFAEKLLPRAARGEMDKYLCKVATTTVAVWTATVCDSGLLFYDRQTP